MRSSATRRLFTLLESISSRNDLLNKITRKEIEDSRECSDIQRKINEIKVIIIYAGAVIPKLKKDLRNALHSENLYNNIQERLTIVNESIENIKYSDQLESIKEAAEGILTDAKNLKSELEKDLQNLDTVLSIRRKKRFKYGMVTIVLCIVLFGLYIHWDTINTKMTMLNKNLKRGQTKWTFETNHLISATPVVSKDKVFVACTDHYLYALDKATGNVIWKFDAGNDMVGTPVIIEDKIYFGSDKFFVLDIATGKKVWEKEIEGEMSYGSPAFSENTLYFSTVGHKNPSYVYAVDWHTGKEKWRFAVNKLLTIRKIFLGYLPTYN